MLGCEVRNTVDRSIRVLRQFLQYAQAVVEHYPAAFIIKLLIPFEM